MSASSTQNFEKIKKVENFIKWFGVALAIVSAVFIYIKSSSVWLAVFGFLLVAKFFGGELPHVIYHKNRLRRILFYLSFPLFAIVLLYFTYQLWGKMWISVLIGFVVGFILNVLLGGLFKADEIYDEDLTKTQNEVRYNAEKLMEENPIAVAMKERFSEGEWQEIKPIPAFMVGLVVSSAPAAKNNALKLYIDTIYDPSIISDPLLKMMFIDLQIEMNAKSGDMNPLGALTGLNKVQSSDAISGILSGVKPESMVMIENALNPEEFREFLRGLFQFTMKMVYVGGKPKPDQVKLIMDFFMTFVSSKQEFMAVFNDASL